VWIPFPWPSRYSFILPNSLGFKKTFAYCFLVVLMATISGMLFGAIAG
jgi:hypothetical protein